MGDILRKATVLSANMKRTACVMLALSSTCGASYTEGQGVVPEGGTSFLSKFCFMTAPTKETRAGRIEVRIRVPKLSEEHHAQMIVLDDETGSYPGGSWWYHDDEWNSLTCAEKLARSKVKTYAINATATSKDGHTRTVYVHQSVRPRWWYVVLVNCAGPELDYEYSVHSENLLNGKLGELSWDLRFAPIVYATCSVLYGCLAMAQFRANTHIKSIMKYDCASGKASNPFAKVLTAGILLQCAAAVLSLLHCGFHVMRGVGIPAVYVLAKCCFTSSAFFLMSLLLLVSQGKCVSCVMVVGDAKHLVRQLSPFLLSSFVLELWGEYSDAKNYSTDYVYSTPYGWVVVLIDVVIFGTYASNLRDTLIAEQNRGDEHFYRTWGIVYGSWFLALPLSALLSYCVLATYVRHIVSLAIVQFATFVTYGALVAGLWPLRPEPHFKLAFAPLEDVGESCVTPKSLESCVTPKRRRSNIERCHHPAYPSQAAVKFCTDDCPTLLRQSSYGEASKS